MTSVDAYVNEEAILSVPAVSKRLRGFTLIEQRGVSSFLEASDANEMLDSG